MHAANINDRRKKEMVKKLIAGALSGTLFLSAVMTEGLFSLPEIGQKRSVQSQSKNQDPYDLKVTNSLGNFITKSKEENDINAKNLSTPENILKSFSVTNLGFDVESGQLVAASTQTEACEIVFSFVDEETKDVVQEIRAKVDAGESLITQAKADTGNLPRYYEVTAHLADKSGKVLSNKFVLNTYTKIMQEIAATDIHDFNEGQVVNFDESEDTNFIVLSEDTIIADSTEEKNNLVSADYNSNTFVIDNIDETVSDLKSGEYFYMQANEDDIIAVAVDNVDIDGDTATITGSDNIDEMFAFVKFEAVNDNCDMTVDTSETEDCITFPDHEGDGEVFETKSDQPLNYICDVRKGLDINSESSYKLSLDGHLGDESGKLSGSITFKLKINFCKKWGYTSFGVSLTIDCKAAFTMKTPDDWKKTLK